MSSNRPSAELPVLIAGAGPCGLVAAATLQQKNVPFVVLEKAQRASICSNAGSGFDLAPAALEILQSSRLNIRGLRGCVKAYSGLCFEDMQGKRLRHVTMSRRKDPEDAVKGNLATGCVNRAEIQNVLLDHLFPSSSAEEGVLICGVSVASYETQPDYVEATLSDGTKMKGSVLLGCDGIRSNVRKCMMEAAQHDDPLHFCNTIAFWGKCSIGKEGSTLETALQRTQGDKTDEGQSAIVGMGTRRSPASFYGFPLNDKVVWGLFIKSTLSPQSGDDLTRRGGQLLDDDQKLELLDSLSDKQSICRLCLENTEASAITRAGIFDRKNLDLPYSDGDRVVILGDAAHPQTPYMGQGANMAIVDAYVICCRLAMEQITVQSAIRAFDTKARREGVKRVVQQARYYAKMSVSSNWLTLWAFRLFVQVIPGSMFESMEEDSDKANIELLEALDRDLAKV